MVTFCPLHACDLLAPCPLAPHLSASFRRSSVFRYPMDSLIRLLTVARKTSVYLQRLGVPQFPRETRPSLPPSPSRRGLLPEASGGLRAGFSPQTLETSGKPILFQVCLGTGPAQWGLGPRHPPAPAGNVQHSGASCSRRCPFSLEIKATAMLISVAVA